MNDDVWYGRNGNQVRCPFPGCSHAGNIITKAHCRMAHGMERKEIGKLYGPPDSVGSKRWNIKRGWDV